MKKSEIPADVMSSIRKSAKEEWADDAEMVEHYIDTEVDAYKALHKVEFGTAAAVKREILEGAAEVEDRWEDRLSIVESEVEAYQELQADFNDVPDALVRELKAEAAREHPGDYGTQRDHVVNGVSAYHYIEELKTRVGPVQHILLKMEQIIGNECYNANIQNYGRGGVWLGEGRSFRYPVTFLDGDDTMKRQTVPGDIAPEVLMTGRYKFGSNELSIFRALVKIVEMIESDYGIRLSDAAVKK